MTYVQVGVRLGVVRWDGCSFVIVPRFVDCLATPSGWDQASRLDLCVNDIVVSQRYSSQSSSIDLTGLESICTSSSCGISEGVSTNGWMWS